MNNNYDVIAKQVRRDIINMLTDAGSGIEFSTVIKGNN